MTILEELADKFIQAGYGNTPIENKDLHILGIYEIPKTFETKEHRKIKTDSWQNFCTYIYEKISDKPMPKCSLIGRGFRSQFFGKAVSKAILNIPIIKESQENA